LERGSALHTQDGTNKKEHTQTSMPQVGFEPMISMFERARTINALDRGATVIGWRLKYLRQMKEYTGEKRNAVFTDKYRNRMKCMTFKSLRRSQQCSVNLTECPGT
jgi:hypothetical protein